MILVIHGHPRQLEAHILRRPEAGFFCNACYFDTAIAVHHKHVSDPPNVSMQTLCWAYHSTAQIDQS